LGQAQPISGDAAGLVNYQSPNSVQTIDDQAEEPPDPELLRIRGEARGDAQVHHMISWTTRKDYALIVGISLPIPDLSEHGAHEGQLWEEADQQWILSENQAEHVYTWFMNRLNSRSTLRMLPAGMPETVDEVSVQTHKDGKAGYMLFTPRVMIATPIKDMDLKILMEYDQGYMMVGSKEAYTIKMISDHFMALTQNQWELFPVQAYRRLINGTVVHKMTADFWEGQRIKAEDAKVVSPVMILEERGRGTEIHNIPDQDHLLQYWAWAQLPLEVGVMFPDEHHVIEFWM
jgi:hypothetical protein